METATEVTRVILGDDYYGYRFPVPSRYSNDFMAPEDTKWAILASIGIERREGITPLVAWRDAVADESGRPREELNPQTGRGLDLGFSPTYVRQWAFYLA